MIFDLKPIEYDKVIQKIKELSRLGYAKENILELRPSADYEVVLRLLNETLEANMAIYRYSDFPLLNLEGVREYLDYCNKQGVLEAENFLSILNLLDNIKQLIEYKKNLGELNKIATPYLDNYFSALEYLPRLKSSISLAINSEGKIIDSASKELFQIRRKLAISENRLRQAVNSVMVSEASKLQEMLIVIRDSRMCLPVKIEYKNSFQGILHDISSSNNTCYIEPAVAVALANDLEKLKEEEKQEIRRILESLSLLVRGEYDILVKNLNLIIDLEVIYTKARYASDSMPMPTLSKNFEFNFTNVKHPLIAEDKCVPISIQMKQNENTIIITGPNTGGKTVTIKTVALLASLIQSGIFVAASKSPIVPVFSNILADIGDEQSIEESLSTFSGHMSNIVRILNMDLNKSLVIFDELGSGTDPKEGSALGIAILEELNKRGCKSIITTHYSDLKNFAYNNKGVVNASVEFNPQTLKPTYRVLLGIPGKSNAVDIAYSLGLDSTIVQRSRDILASDGTNDSRISEYEDKLLELDSLKQELENSKKEALELTRSLQNEKNNLIKNRDQLLKKAKLEAEKIILDAKAESSSLLNEIKQLKETADLKISEIAKLKNRSNNLNVKDNEEELFDEEINIGDYIIIKEYKQTAQVKDIKKDRYYVDMGQFRMDFSKKEIMKTTPPIAKKEKKITYSGYNSVSGAAMSLDLRGKRYEEIRDLVELFIDKACLANYEQVTIIHGFGTGVVRKRVHEILNQNRNVKSYRFGKEGEGLNGATVVLLK